MPLNLTYKQRNSSDEFSMIFSSYQKFSESRKHFQGKIFQKQINQTCHILYTYIIWRCEHCFLKLENVLNLKYYPVTKRVFYVEVVEFCIRLQCQHKNAVKSINGSQSFAQLFKMIKQQEDVIWICFQSFLVTSCTVSSDIFLYLIKWKDSKLQF